MTRSSKVLALVCSLCFASCSSQIPNANLQAASSLGTAAESARVGYALVANDYQASCERTYRLQHLVIAEENHLANVSRHSKQIDTLNAKIAALSYLVRKHASDKDRTHMVGAINELRAQLAIPAPATTPPPNNCDSSDVVNAETAWNGWNNLLLNFFVALGKLANPPASDAYGLSAVAKRISDSVNGDTQVGVHATKVANAADSVFNAVIAKKKRRAISAAGDVTNLVDETVDALKSVEKIYVTVSLRNEELAVNSFYSSNLDAIPAGAPILGSYQDFLNQWSAALNAVELKRRAAQAYVESLDSLKVSYSAVVSSAQNKSDAAGAVTQYLQQLEPALTAISQAFGTPSKPPPTK